METGTESKRVQRRRYTKTKFGCRTCKSVASTKVRKVRCDETWPTCQNCDRTGRQCDGVSPEAARNNSNTVTFIPPLTVSHFQPLPTRYDLHNLDIRSQQVRRHRLMHCIVGELGRPPWDPLMRQAALEKPFFEGCLMAFVCLCRTYTQVKMDMVAWAPQETDLDEGVRAFLCAGDMSLRMLQDEVQGGVDEFGRSSSAAVLCDLVSIFLELMMDKADVALCHLEQSIEMLRHFQVEHNLAMILMRLDRLASNIPVLGPPQDLLGSLTVPAAAFHELDTELTYILNNLLLFLQRNASIQHHQNPTVTVVPQPLDLLLEAKALEQELRQCQAHILPPETAASPRYVVFTSPEDAYLRMRFLTGIILSAKALYAGETIYDTLLDEFSAILDYSTYLLHEQDHSLTITAAEDPSLHPHPEIAYSAAVVQPLYITACKCRSSGIRRRAIALMDEAACFDKAHSARMHAAVGRRIIQWEEEGSLSEAAGAGNPVVVPEWCRIHAAELRPVGEEAKFAEVVFGHRPNGLGGEWREFLEVVFW
ncbi:hypothetical protein E4U34_000928 [Claviceps purpurea]|nr:hypothetical protein E4U34_000928 [Claviceps purpurea]